jgi:hypothetical protein
MVNLLRRGGGVGRDEDAGKRNGEVYDRIVVGLCIML